MPMTTRRKKLQRGGSKGASPFYSLPTARNRSTGDQKIVKDQTDTMKTRSKLFSSPASKYDGVTPSVPANIEQTSSESKAPTLEEASNKTTETTKDVDGGQNTRGEESDSSSQYPSIPSLEGPEHTNTDGAIQTNSPLLDKGIPEISGTDASNVERREEISEQRSSDPRREVTASDVTEHGTNPVKDSVTATEKPVELESAPAPAKDDARGRENPVEMGSVLSGKRLSYGDNEDTRTQKPKKMRKNSILLPDDLSVFDHANLTAMERRLAAIHECFTSFREQKAGSCYPYPKGVIFSLKLDLPFLETSAKECKSSTDMYANYVILDTATQWMFHRDHEDRFALNLPAHMCEIINDKHRKDKIENFGNCIEGWNNFFDYSVVSMFIWHGQHFSMAFIVNAGVIYKKKIRTAGRPFKEDDPPFPCILYSNSLHPGGAHHKDSVSRSIRTFLNNKGGMRIFNTDNLPAIDINTCRQEDSFSCGYHSIMARHTVLKSLRERTITESEVKMSTNREQYVKRDFTYKPSDALTVRDGIRELVLGIARMKEARVSTLSSMCEPEEDLEKVDRPLCRPKAAAKAQAKKKEVDEKRSKKQQKREMMKPPGQNDHARKKIKRSRKKEREKVRNDHLAEKKKKKEAMRLAQWKPRLESEVSKEERDERLEETKRHVDRPQGAPAASLQHYKDKAYRRGLFHLTESTAEMAGTCRYKFASYDHLARTKVFTVIIDEVGPSPHLRNCAEPPIRKKPVRIAIGSSSKEEFKEFVRDMRKNWKDFILTDDSSEIDELVMGTDRPCLSQFIQKKKKVECDSDREEDKEKCSRAQDNLLKSAKKKVEGTESIRLDDGF